MEGRGNISVSSTDGLQENTERQELELQHIQSLFSLQAVTYIAEFVTYFLASDSNSNRHSNLNKCKSLIRL